RSLVTSPSCCSSPGSPTQIPSPSSFGTDRAAGTMEATSESDTYHYLPLDPKRYCKLEIPDF
ncbi:MAG: hypothetical protein VX285_07225, partial [Actinomycetota bacterium]|nr:hypothetical protein [Actinomycetota bacterium]